MSVELEARGTNPAHRVILFVRRELERVMFTLRVAPNTTSPAIDVDLRSLRPVADLTYRELKWRNTRKLSGKRKI